MHSTNIANSPKWTFPTLFNWRALVWKPFGDVGRWRRSHFHQLYIFFTAEPFGVFAGCKSQFNAQLVEIGHHAFYKCRTLKVTDFGNATQMETIGASAFASCRSLSKVELPSNLHRIGQETFQYSLCLKNFATNEQLETIGDRAFFSNRKLTNVDFGDAKKPKRIGNEAFAECNALQRIDLSEAKQLAMIGEKSCASCSSLTSLILSRNIKNQPSAFYEYYKIVDFTPATHNVHFFVDAVMNKTYLNVLTFTETTSHWQFGQMTMDRLLFLDSLRQIRSSDLLLPKLWHSMRPEKEKLREIQNQELVALVRCQRNHYT
jgi:hypothetical protein